MQTNLYLHASIIAKELHFTKTEIFAMNYSEFHNWFDAINTINKKQKRV